MITSLDKELLMKIIYNEKKKQNKTKTNAFEVRALWKTLILQNCLPLSREHAKFTSKKITQYLLGSRNGIDLFKFNEIKHILFRFTPLIETLFNSKRILLNTFGAESKTRNVKLTPPKNPAKIAEWKIRTKGLKISKKFTHSFYNPTQKMQPIKILFATTNPLYKELIAEAALLCNMPFHNQRWLCGYLSASSRYINDRVDAYQDKTLNTNAFFKNKESVEKRYDWHKVYNNRNHPAFIIIPDIENNNMILRETFIRRIPIIGLINTECVTTVDYPVFGNVDSIQIVHFFCNFLAFLITKSFIKQDYKQQSSNVFNRTLWYNKRLYFKIKAKAKLNKKAINKSKIKQKLYTKNNFNIRNNIKIPKAYKLSKYKNKQKLYKHKKKTYSASYIKNKFHWLFNYRLKRKLKCWRSRLKNKKLRIILKQNQKKLLRKKKLNSILILKKRNNKNLIIIKKPSKKTRWRNLRIKNSLRNRIAKKLSWQKHFKRITWKFKIIKNLWWKYKPNKVRKRFITTQSYKYHFNNNLFSIFTGTLHRVTKKQIMPRFSFSNILEKRKSQFNPYVKNKKSETKTNKFLATSNVYTIGSKSSRLLSNNRAKQKQDRVIKKLISFEQFAILFEKKITKNNLEKNNDVNFQPSLIRYRNIKFMRFFMKKNPYLTSFLLYYLKNIPHQFIMQLPSLILSERNNVAKSTYKFSSIHLKKQNTVSHEMLWTHHYWTNYLIYKKSGKIINTKFKRRRRYKYEPKATFKNLRFHKRYAVRNTITLWLKYKIKYLIATINNSQNFTTRLKTRQWLINAKYYKARWRKYVIKHYIFWSKLDLIKNTNKLNRKYIRSGRFWKKYNKQNKYKRNKNRYNKYNRYSLNNQNKYNSNRTRQIYTPFGAMTNQSINHSENQSLFRKFKDLKKKKRKMVTNKLKNINKQTYNRNRTKKIMKNILENQIKFLYAKVRQSVLKLDLKSQPKIVKIVKNFVKKPRTYKKFYLKQFPNILSDPIAYSKILKKDKELRLKIFDNLNVHLDKNLKKKRKNGFKLLLKNYKYFLIRKLNIKSKINSLLIPKKKSTIKRTRYFLFKKGLKYWKFAEKPKKKRREKIKDILYKQKMTRWLNLPKVITKKFIKSINTGDNTNYQARLELRTIKKHDWDKFEKLKTQIIIKKKFKKKYANLKELKQDLISKVSTNFYYPPNKYRKKWTIKTIKQKWLSSLYGRFKTKIRRKKKSNFNIIY